MGAEARSALCIDSLNIMVAALSRPSGHFALEVMVGVQRLGLVVTALAVTITAAASWRWRWSLATMVTMC